MRRPARPVNFARIGAAPSASGVQQHVLRTQVMLHFALEHAIGMLVLEVLVLEPLCKCRHGDDTLTAGSAAIAAGRRIRDRLFDDARRFR